MLIIGRYLSHQIYYVIKAWQASQINIMHTIIGTLSKRSLFHAIEHTIVNFLIECILFVSLRSVKKFLEVRFC